MRIYGAFLAGIGAFFGVISLIYWFSSYEDGGFLMLIGSALLGLFPGSYYLWWSTKGKRQADDDPTADVAEGAGTVESFPGSSIWPFIIGMGALFAVLTFVFGLWMAPLAATLILSGAIGGTVESRRGGQVHIPPQPATASGAGTPHTPEAGGPDVAPSSPDA
jgi:uncharacterized membrane protein